MYSTCLVQGTKLIAVLVLIISCDWVFNCYTLFLWVKIWYCYKIEVFGYGFTSDLTYYSQVWHVLLITIMN